MTPTCADAVASGGGRPRGPCTAAGLPGQAAAVTGSGSPGVTGAWWWPPPTPPACRPEPALGRRPARARQPAPGSRPGRDRADLPPPRLGRAELQAGRGRARPGRLPGPLRHRDPPPPGPEHGRGKRGPRAALPPPAPSWPRALRAIRAWLTPWIVRHCWWPARSKAPPPPQVQALMNSLAAGHGLHLYLPN